MMREYNKYGLLLVVLSCWAPMAVADQMASRVAPTQWMIYPPPASGVGVANSPEDDYQAALKADQDDDMVGASRLYRRAAERGHAAAQVMLAGMLWNGSAKEEASKWFRKAAEQGNAEGQLGLAMIYMADQKEKTWVMKKDFAEARKWLELAANQGNKQAIITIADAYINGGMDLNKDAQDSPEALAWIKRAVDIDNIPALNALASAYRSGKYGLTPDLKQATDLEDKAKKLGGVVEAKKKSKKTR